MRGSLPLHLLVSALGLFLWLRQTEFSDSALGSALWTRAEESALRTRSEERHPAQEKSSEGFQCALRVFVRACFAAVLRRHWFQGSTWFQPQLIVTSCHIRYLSHSLHQRSSEQL